MQKRKTILNQCNYSNHVRWSYDLTHQAIAAAASGMHKFTGLDDRCVKFTVHLQDPARHRDVCSLLFGIAEKFFDDLCRKKPSITHCGLMSFLDVNGSKFTGASRDLTQAHCHGFLFTPHGVVDQEYSQLSDAMADAVRSCDGVKSAANAVQVARFDVRRGGPSLRHAVQYAQKEAVRCDTVGTFGVFLPFDIRNSYGCRPAQHILGKRDAIMLGLESVDCFKVYRA